jgi:transposase-like protein
MGEFEVTIEGEIIQGLILGDRDEAIRQLIESIFNDVLNAEMDEHLQAAKYERTEKRSGSRNGYYERELTMRVGALSLRVPRDREGAFKTAIFERYQRNEKALVLAMMEMVINGVSTRKVKRITDELCGRGFSKSTVSRLCEQLDERVEGWAERPLLNKSYPFVLVDALQVKVRRQGAIRSTGALVAIGINEDGYREILGLKIANSETHESWTEFFRSLKQRGLTGVDLVVSDAHQGLVDAVHKCFQGASWQRCQTHFRRNILDKTSKSLHGRMSKGLDAIFGADDINASRQAFNELCADLDGKADKALETLELGLEDATAVLRLPQKYRVRLRTTNMVERLNSEIRRREKVIRIFPNARSAWRLVGAYLMEQHEEWATGRRYFDMETYDAWKAALENENQSTEAAALMN